MKLIFCVLISLLAVACASKPKALKMSRSTNEGCQNNLEHAPLEDVLKTLGFISELYDQKCFREVIALGDFVRAHSRDKFYHVVNETLEFVTPEGTFTEYVLESYERSYLSFLMASSYEQLASKDGAQVELRKAYQEGQALLYNYGDDPVNLVLQAAVWENSRTSGDSRPLWKKVTELAGSNLALKTFAEKRIQEIDSGRKPVKPWKVYAIGLFPGLDWETSMTKSSGSYFVVKPKSSFPVTCGSDESLLLSTEAWAQKISHKYDQDYHPLLHLQTWTRLPVGLTMGALTAVSGAGVAVAGCGADFALTKDAHSHPLCEASLAFGGKIIGETGNVTGYVLRPDLRYWSQLPSAFWITQDEKSAEDFCRPQTSERKQLAGFSETGK
jgi:hypothetical protein